MTANRYNWIAGWTLALILCAEPAKAISLDFIELVSGNGEEKAYIQVQDLVSVDAQGKAHLNLHPDRNANHHQITSALSAGMPFGDPAVRDGVAGILALYPAASQPHLKLSLEVCPIGDIDAFVPGVKDKRRISGIAVNGYLKQTPRECLYDIFKTGEVDFDIGMFRGVLKECRAATEAAIERGEPYADAVYAAHPSLKKSTRN